MTCKIAQIRGTWLKKSHVDMISHATHTVTFPPLISSHRGKISMKFGLKIFCNPLLTILGVKTRCTIILERAWGIGEV